jgi:hypothetical protein
MPKAAQGVAKNLKDVKVTDITQTTTSSKMTMFELKVTGTEADGPRAVFVMSGFTPGKGIYFIASASATADVFAANEKEYRQVVNGIWPIE